MNDYPYLLAERIGGKWVAVQHNCFLWEAESELQLLKDGAYFKQEKEHYPAENASECGQCTMELGIVMAVEATGLKPAMEAEWKTLNNI